MTGVDGLSDRISTVPGPVPNRSVIDDLEMSLEENRRLDSRENLWQFGPGSSAGGSGESHNLLALTIERAANIRGAASTPAPPTMKAFTKLRRLGISAP